MSKQHIDTSKGSANVCELSGAKNDIMVFGYAAQLLDREMESESEQGAPRTVETPLTIEIPQALGYLASKDALTDSNN